MHASNKRRHAALAATALLAALLAGCSTLGAEPAIPEGAVASTHTAANGDVISEYRVDGQLRMVRVQPARGPVYYLIDHDGDGHVDPKNGDLPLTYYKLYGW